MSRVVDAVLTFAHRRGFEIRRHPASRRQAMFAALGVDLVLDVGASDGGFGRQVRQFGYTGRLVSFEPLSQPYASLSETIADDPSWVARHHALGDQAGSADINIASNSASSSLLPMMDTHRRASPDVDYVGTETIRIDRLDDVAAEFVQPDDHVFLKIDTQGFERQVLAGATETLSKCVGLQLELSLVALYEGGMLIDEAIAWAYAEGFRLSVVEQGWAAPTGEMLQVDGIFFRT